MKILLTFSLLVLLFIAASSLNVSAQNPLKNLKKHSRAGKRNHDIQQGKKRAPRDLRSKSEIENIDVQHDEQQQSGFHSSSLAQKIYCEKDVRRLCWKGPMVEKREEKRWGDVNGLGPDKDPRVLTPTECLQQQQGQINSTQCRSFIRGRQFCLNDFEEKFEKECHDLLPYHDVADRYWMRKHKLDSRKARLDLRRKLHGDKSKFDDTYASKSKSESQQADSSSSPSMSLSDELMSEDEKQYHERQKILDEQFEKEKKEAEDSSRRSDHFMSLCAALFTEEEAKQRLSEKCKNSPVIQHLPFNSEHHASLAERKKETRKSNKKRFEKALSKQEKLMDKLKDRVTRHHLDKLDDEIADGKSDLSEDETTERGRFLLHERKQRELRRRRMIQKQYARHGKDLENTQPGDLPTKFSRTRRAVGGKYRIDPKTGKRIFDDDNDNDNVDENKEHSESISEGMKKEANQL